ncbi:MULTISPECIES: hypothetical protein [Bradyrhizobium]|uniref:hypothetical protein n=1 Tax=Bradyrhizobium elkanii TaxID=29448 RepID=UPI000483FB91|nr:hypothetical protein [Bradyrhizobium elkanii]
MTILAFNVRAPKAKEPPLWWPMFSLPNDQVKFPIKVEGFALVPTDDFRFEAIKKKQPRLGNFLERFKTEFGDAGEPSTIVWRKDKPDPNRSGADRLTCDCCPPVFSRRLYLTWPRFAQSSTGQELIVRPATSMRTSEGACARQRTSAAIEYFRTPRATRKFFADAPATVRHRAEASLLMAAANSASVRPRSPASYSTIIQRTRLTAS